MKNIHTSGDTVVSVVPYHKGQVFTILEGFVETPQAQVRAQVQVQMQEQVGPAL